MSHIGGNSDFESSNSTVITTKTAGRTEEIFHYQFFQRSSPQMWGQGDGLTDPSSESFSANAIDQEALRVMGVRH